MGELEGWRIGENWAVGNLNYRIETRLRGLGLSNLPKIFWEFRVDRFFTANWQANVVMGANAG